MSCFESSTFFKNPEVMDQQVLLEACKILGWKCQVEGKELLVYHPNPGVNLHGEPALRVRGNQVTYNTYYMKDGTKLMKELADQFYELNVEYAKQGVMQEFGKADFHLAKDWANPEIQAQLATDRIALLEEARRLLEIRFAEMQRRRTAHTENRSSRNSGDVMYQFSMMGYTENPFEEETETEIQFRIFRDGTLVTDSNYIPHDVHDRADRAMEGLDRIFGTIRREGIEIKRKPIPARYKDKAFCEAPSEAVVLG